MNDEKVMTIEMKVWDFERIFGILYSNNDLFSVLMGRLFFYSLALL